MSYSRSNDGRGRSRGYKRHRRDRDSNHMPSLMPHQHPIMPVPPMMQMPLAMHGGHYPVDNPLRDDTELRLKAYIARIGEKTQTSLEDNIERLADMIEDDLRDYADLIIKTLILCATEMPYKSPIYATVIGILNVRHYRFGRDFVAQVKDRLIQAFENYERYECKTMLHFVAELVNNNVVPASSLIGILQLLLYTIYEEKLNECQSDWIIYLIISTIPFAGAELAMTNSVQLTSLMNDIEAYLRTIRNRPTGNLLSAFPNAHKSDDLLLNLWKALLAQKHNNWKSVAILTTFVEFADILDRAKQHALELKTIPKQNKAPYFHLRPDVRIFEDEKDKQYGSIDRIIVSEYVADAFYFFKENHKEAAKQIFSLPIRFDYREVVVETFFSNLFTLPESEFPEVYYGVVVTNLFKMAPKHIPPILGRAVNSLFLNLHDLDVECRERLARWHAIHLSNFSYMWPWASWKCVLTQQETNPQRLYVKNVLALCVRLSYWERVQKTLPDEFSELMPDIPTEAFRFAAQHTKTGGDDVTMNSEDQKDNENNETEAEPTENDLSTTDQAELSNIITTMLKTKATTEVILKFLEDRVAVNGGNEASLKLFFPTLLNVSKQSYSHFVVYLVKYQDVIRNLAKDLESQMILVHSVCDYWQHSQQRIIVILDKLVTFGIVEPKTIVTWLFENSDIFHEMYLWEILSRVLYKTLRRLDVMRLQLLEQQENETKTNEHEADNTEIASINNNENEITNETAENDDKNDSKEDKKPTEKKIIQLDFDEEKLDRMKQEVFLVLFQRFCMLLNSVKKSSADNSDPVGEAATEIENDNGSGNENDNEIENDNGSENENNNENDEKNEDDSKKNVVERIDSMYDIVFARLTQFARSNVKHIKPLLPTFTELFADSSSESYDNRVAILLDHLSYV